MTRVDAVLNCVRFQLDRVPTTSALAALLRCRITALEALHEHEVAAIEHWVPSSQPIETEEET
jgi:hypothetical protein